MNRDFTLAVLNLAADSRDVAQELQSSKIIALNAAIKIREQLRRDHRKLVLTNGCFDILHAGHIYFLNQAKALGDTLWLCLNSDASVRALKGPDRPINQETYRAYCLSALNAVDAVIVFNSPRLDPEISAIEPDIYCKAGDYSLDTLDPGERGALEAVGTTIRFLPFLSGFSTSNMIEKITQAENAPSTLRKDN